MFVWWEVVEIGASFLQPEMVELVVYPPDRLFDLCKRHAGPWCAHLRQSICNHIKSVPYGCHVGSRLSVTNSQIQWELIECESTVEELMNESCGNALSVTSDAVRLCSAPGDEEPELVRDSAPAWCAAE